MATKLRIGTFNLENLDDKPGQIPTLSERIAGMRSQMIRLDADILCLQEVNGQELSGQPRQLLALDQLLENTPYSEFNRVSTMKADGSEVYDERNLVILSRHEISEHHQYKNEYASAPGYQKVTSLPAEDEAVKIKWERPILYARIHIPESKILHLMKMKML